MKKTLIITTINKPNKNIKLFSNNCKKNKWEFIVIGDKKTPSYFDLKYGNFLNIKKQKKLEFKFSSICPKNNYARKNIGYLLAIKNNADIIIETDDDNCPKRNFFQKIKLFHKVKQINGYGWTNIYLPFLKNKDQIWPRGLSLDNIFSKPNISAKKILAKFYLQQGICEGNPDVDAIYRLMNSKINVKFKNNLKYSLGKCVSPLNSQNTIWFKKVFPLLYLPVTCTMRSTDIWRGLIARHILSINRFKILYFGTTMFQKRNLHNLKKDFMEEIPVYLNSSKIVKILNKVKMKKGEKYFCDNLIKSYSALIKNKIIFKEEMLYLKSWIKDLK
tara:strand:+ start:417 stop:1409 length:993 start_codon:yes stop_codon:yes gene_type:complete